MFVRLGMWFGISVSLEFVGSYVGAQMEAIELAVGTSQVKRRIPEQPWYMQPLLTVFVGGILLFGAIFAELIFIMSSL
jgi:transmembrane 9 superfamily member 2/4